jgi:hypothetical protein
VSEDLPGLYLKTCRGLTGGRLAVFPQPGVGHELRCPPFGFGLLYDPGAADLLGGEVAPVYLAFDGVPGGMREFGDLDRGEHAVRITGGCAVESIRCRLCSIKRN